MTALRRASRVRSRVFVLCAAAALCAGAAGQSQSRVATTRALLLANPLFFHSRAVAIVDVPSLIDGVWQLPAPERKTLAVAFRTAPTTDGPVEIRGSFIDVGRLAPEDSRVTAFGLQPIVQAVVGTGGAWPARETFFAIVNATSEPAPDPTVTSLRVLALFPEKFDGKPVTLRGRFRGRNLVGDLPVWPRQSDADFVLQAADGAVWVTGQKPKGKGFDLDPNARRDLGRWLEVRGTAGVVQGLPVVKATAVAAAAPEDDTIVAEDKPAAPILPPPTLSFSIPSDGETDIATTTTIRAQFSRDMKAESFETHVQLACTAGGAAASCPQPKLNYRAATLTLEITFDTPLPRFSTVTVNFLDGITTNDGVALKPTHITFATGG